MSDAMAQAKAYVAELRRRGRPEAEIAQRLQEAGWSAEKVSELLRAPREPIAPPPPLSTPAYVRPAARPGAAAGPGSAAGSRARTEESSGLAIAALVLGLVSLILPLAIFTGTLAIILGAISLAKRRAGTGMAIAGLALGAMCLALVLLILPAIFFPVFARARDKARQAVCLSNVKQLSTGLLMYSVDYESHLPPAGAWPQLIKPYVKDPGIGVCPQDTRDTKQSTGGVETSYTMNRAVGGASPSAVAQPGNVAMLCDGTQVAGGAEAAEFRHAGGLNVGYLDGHAQWVPGPEGQSGSPSPGAGPGPPER